MIIVRPPHGNEIELDLDDDVSATDVLTLLRSQHGNNPAINMAELDGEETDAQGRRVIKLKTNAKRKG